MQNIKKQSRSKVVTDTPEMNFATQPARDIQITEGPRKSYTEKANTKFLQEPRFRQNPNKPGF
jgi:hypothetical protein